MPTICYSADGETFNHDSLGGLIDSHELQAGDTYHEADSEPVTASDCLSEHMIDGLLEAMDDRLVDMVGEAADTDFGDVSHEARDELRSLVLTWAERHIDVARYWRIIGKPRERVLTPEDVFVLSEGGGNG